MAALGARPCRAVEGFGGVELGGGGAVCVRSCVKLMLADRMTLNIDTGSEPGWHMMNRT